MTLSHIPKTVLDIRHENHGTNGEVEHLPALHSIIHWV